MNSQVARALDNTYRGSRMVLPTPARETRQARKGATVAAAGVWRGHQTVVRSVLAPARAPAPTPIPVPASASALLALFALAATSIANAQDGPVIIDTPPSQQPPASTAQVAPTPRTAPQTLKPGEIAIHGTPVRLKLRGSQPGIGFQLSAGRAETSTFGYGFEYGYPRGYGFGYGQPYGFGSPYGYRGFGYGGYAPFAAYSSTEVFRPICQAPCEVSIVSGQYSMALSLNGGPPVQADVVDIATPATLVGHYVSRRRIRRIGWIVFGLGAIAGTVMVASSLDYNTFDDDIRIPALFGTGIGVLFGSVAAGATMASQRDTARIEVVPH